MALSKEYTYWHLTPNGWMSGDTKTDFGSKSVNEPKDTVLTILYKETVNNPVLIEKSIERYEVSKDLELIKYLEEKYPFNGYIEIAK